MTSHLLPHLKTLMHFYRISGIRWTLEDTDTSEVIPSLENHALLSMPHSTSHSQELSINLDEIHSLEALRHALESFEGCALKHSATHLVFADGNPNARVMFIGEAPGFEEDKKGRPFVGRAGQLLDRMLASIDLDRSSVYITNTIPWRPPGNRAPAPDELAACAPFLHRHIALCNPDIIVCLGGVSAQALLGIKGGILRNRGHWLTYSVGDKHIPALATLHPAYLLRQPAQKALAWKDLCALREKLDSLPLREQKECDIIEKLKT